jgi:hypothetical protein
MRRSELEHIIRAAAAITLHDEFVILGSQAILGEHPDAPETLLASVEVDLYPRAKPEDSVLIDGAIGEESAFHDTFGYYAHGVAPETASLPEGWDHRLIPIQNAGTTGAIGWCLETNDLAVSKLIAGREKDLAFVARLLDTTFADPAVIAERLSKTSISATVRDLCIQRLQRLQKQ